VQWTNTNISEWVVGSQLANSEQVSDEMLQAFLDSNVEMQHLPLPPRGRKRKLGDLVGDVNIAKQAMERETRETGGEPGGVGSGQTGGEPGVVGSGQTGGEQGVVGSGDTGGEQGDVGSGQTGGAQGGSKPIPSADGRAQGQDEDDFGDWETSAVSDITLLTMFWEKNSYEDTIVSSECEFLL